VLTNEARLEKFVRCCFDESGGHGLTQDGSGVTAAFDTPISALHFFTKLGAPLGPHGSDIQAGLHVGPIEMTPHGPSGPALVIAAQLLRMAQPGEVLLSRTVQDLLPADVQCEPHPGPPPRVLGTTWDVYRVKHTGERR
jgi:class 3 adenylate cyclase